MIMTDPRDFIASNEAAGDIKAAPVDDQSQQPTHATESHRTKASPATVGQLIAVGSVTHISPDGRPYTHEMTCGRLLSGSEQPYLRVPWKVGPKWQPLDAGWLVEDGQPPVSHVVLSNNEGRNLQTIPDDKTRAAIAARVVEIGLALPSASGDMWDDDSGDQSGASEAVPFAIVRPGDSCRFEPADVAKIMVRCRAGAATCQLSVFPG